MSKNFVALYFLVFLLIQCHAEGSSTSRVDPLVDTDIGLIRGLRASDGDYSMFMGIPYAKVDEKNPFGASTPYPPFQAIFEAYDDTAICPQEEDINFTIVGTLDCLHLNIYVPSVASSKNKLPVLVWFHGGGFNRGFAGRTLFGPKNLVRHDLILVTVNYRLGPYGFLCLDTPEVPGNQGLKDQVLALRWIKNNIESFGGNANQITTMGESAGSMSVDLHMHTMQESLFNRVIMQSGTALITGRIHIQKADVSAPLRLAKALGFISNDTSDALSFLATADPKLVIAASLTDVRYFPCVEKSFENVEAFLADHPVNMNIPKANSMPVLIGVNADEWLGNHANNNLEFYNNWNGFRVDMRSAFAFNETELDLMEEVVRHFYIGDEKNLHDARFKLSNFETDFLFLHPAERTINKYVVNDDSEIYYYMFSYVGDRNWLRWKNNITVGGAAHADEIGYLFDVSFWTDQVPTSQDQLIIDRITTMWANFVKYGNPTPEISELLPVKWEPITSKDSPRFYLNIDTEMTLGKRPYHDRTAFWDLFYKANEKFQDGYDPYDA